MIRVYHNEQFKLSMLVTFSFFIYVVNLDMEGTIQSVKINK